MKYIGNTCSDAEIEMNLEKGNIKMKYSGKSNFSNSNNMSFDTEFKKGKIIYAIYILFSPLFVISCKLVTDQVRIIMETYFVKFWKKHNLQYEYQKITKDFLYCLDGIVTERIEGKLHGKTLVIPLRNNLFVEYELKGDYKEFVTKISLKQRIIKVETPVLKEKIQRGWLLIMNFKEPPLSGFVEVKYIG